MTISSGRSLLDNPLFLALARQYESRIAPARRATIDDVTSGTWHVLVLAPGREPAAINRVADDLHLPCYLPMREYVVQGRRGYRRMRAALFVGYGFVRALNIKEWWGRLRACSGVRSIMVEAGTNGIPAVIAPGLIDLIMLVEGRAAVTADPQATVTRA